MLALVICGFLGIWLSRNYKGTEKQYLAGVGIILIVLAIPFGCFALFIWLVTEYCLGFC